LRTIASVRTWTSAASGGDADVVEGGVVGLRHVVPLLVLEGEAGG
jgi:hypothetical protein